MYEMIIAPMEAFVLFPILILLYVSMTVLVSVSFKLTLCLTIHRRSTVRSTGSKRT